MSSIKDLEMAAAVSSYKNISIKKGFLGLSQKAVYVPSQSPVKAMVYEYAPADGERMEQLLNMPLEKMAVEIQAKGKPAPAAIGHFRLEACISEDRQFCALQLFRFVDFKYNPAFPVKFFEGKDVELISKIF